jgi:hypothetical protein
MSDILGTYDTLVNHLLSLTLTGIATSDIAWDNSDFDPSGKTAWLDTFYIPADIDIASKGAAGQEQSGLFQVSVYVPANDSTGGVKQYARRQMQIMGEVLAGFATNTEASYNSVTVSILDSTVQPARKSGGWYVRDITINYYRLGE